MPAANPVVVPAEPAAHLAALAVNSPAQALRIAALGALALLLGACAGVPPDGSSTPRLARLSVEDMARLAPDAPKLSLDDLVAMAKAGSTPETVVGRFRQSGARFDLTPAQVVDLHARGLPLPVLQAIHEDREKALRADLTQMLVERDQQCSAEVAQERQRARSAVDPFCGPAFYGPLRPYPIYPYSRRGMFWGW